MNKIDKLKEENKILKRKLKTAELWTKRIVKEEIQKITKKEIQKMENIIVPSFFEKNMDNIIIDKINKYFWDYILMNTPHSIINNIIWAEINYYNLVQNKWFDGISIIASYHKAIDTLIENNISKGYRKYCKKIWQIFLRKNDVLEKSMHSLVNKWFILSIWRLFHLIKLIKNNEDLFDYWKAFLEYLNNNENLKNILLNNDFYNIFSNLMKYEVFWKKRHTWIISLEDTTRVRYYIIWNFIEKNSLLYKIAEINKIDY